MVLQKTVKALMRATRPEHIHSDLARVDTDVMRNVNGVE